MFVLALAATALAAAPASPVLAAAPCATMMTQRMPLEKRASPLDSASATIGGKEVKVCYSRPAAKGRTIFGGELVPFGKLWRTGANEPTMIHLDGAAAIAGVKLPAGSYSLYTVPGEASWEIVINKSTSQWGHESAYTDAVKAQEAGRGTVKPEKLKEPVEKLTMGVTGAGKKGAITIEWETTKVTIPVEAQ